MQQVQSWLNRVLLISLFLSGVLPAIHAESEDLSGAATTPTVMVSNESQLCKGLHKVTDMDDLLLQMYNNLDSTCLFDMDSRELEQIWEIKINDYRNRPKSDHLDFAPLFGSHDDFYVRKRIKANVEIFEIKSSRAYKELYQNRDPIVMGEYPKRLPLPEVHTPRGINFGEAHFPYSQIKHTSVYEPYSAYVWLNPQRSIEKPILEIYLDLPGASPEIELQKKAYDSDFQRGFFGPKRLEPCGNLHKVGHIEDLLMQLYQNMDNDCLFTILQYELVMTWQIAVIDYQGNELSYRGVNSNALSMDESFSNGYEAPYVRRIFLPSGDHQLIVVRSQLYYDDLFGSGHGINAGQYPQYLPPPDVYPQIMPDTRSETVTGYFRSAALAMRKTAPVGSVYHPSTDYVWLNPERSADKPILVFHTSPDGVVIFPTLYVNQNAYLDAQ